MVLCGDSLTVCHCLVPAESGRDPGHPRWNLVTESSTVEWTKSCDSGEARAQDQRAEGRPGQQHDPDLCGSSIRVLHS